MTTNLLSFVGDGEIKEKSKRHYSNNSIKPAETCYQASSGIIESSSWVIVGKLKNSGMCQPHGKIKEKSKRDKIYLIDKKKPQPQP